MKRNSGFTLIELLATIVILALIALIATPVVLGVIEKSRTKTLESSAYGLIEAANLYYAQYEPNKNIRFDIENNQITSNDTDKLLSFKGQVKTGTVIINTKGKITVCLTDGTNSAYKNYNEVSVSLIAKERCYITASSSIVYLEKSGATLTELSNQELTEEIANLKSEIAALKSGKANQSDLEIVSSVASNAEELAGNALTSSSLETINTIVSGNQSNISQLQSDVSSLTTSVGTNTSNISTLQTNLSTNYYTKSTVDTISSLASNAQTTADSKTTLANAIDKIYPVGSIYITTTEDTVAKVQAKFGGTWERFGRGRTLVGYTSTDADFNASEKTGGEKTHTLTESEMPSHQHLLRAMYNGQMRQLYAKIEGTVEYSNPDAVVWSSNAITPFKGVTGGYWADTSGTGGSQAHNNLQPYITVFMYKRTA